MESTPCLLSPEARRWMMDGSQAAGCLEEKPFETSAVAWIRIKVRALSSGWRRETETLASNFLAENSELHSIAFTWTSHLTHLRKSPLN
uniref:Uncharacterized protein n=1 Tax=Salix viminalis TaxID=40686 RepID=A0A6N2KT58_SALVM